VNDQPGAIKVQIESADTVTRTAETRDKGSRERVKRDDARKAKETADEKDLEEKESDKREDIALQNKMEAWRIAREIQAAYDPLASLRSEQATTSSKSAAAS